MLEEANLSVLFQLIRRFTLRETARLLPLWPAGLRLEPSVLRPR